jgi:hypothetical protein
MDDNKKQALANLLTGAVIIAILVLVLILGSLSRT